MSFFPRATQSTFYFTNSPLSAVSGNVTNNYYYGAAASNKQFLREPKDDFRTIRAGDLNLLQLVWSDCVEVERPLGFDISKLKPSNPFRVRLESKNRHKVKVMKRIYKAEITGYGERPFTVATFHPEPPSQSGNEDVKWTAWQREYDYWVQRKDAYTLQLFGSCRSTFPALIYHNGLVMGSDIFGRYENRPIIFCYLLYQWSLSFNNVYGFSREMCRISRDTERWWFNPRTDTFQCDPTIILYSDSEHKPKQRRISSNVYALKVDSASETTISFDNRPILLDSQSQGTGINPSIATLRIVNHLRNVLPDYLWSISDMCWARGTGASGLESYAPHGVLTFGSVIIKDQPNVYAYFPFAPTPTWIFHESSSSWPVGVQVEKGELGVTLIFQGDTNGDIDLRFSLEFPPHHRDNIRASFLSQSLRFRDDHRQTKWDPSEFILLDYIRVRFQTKVDFCSRFPVHLFIPSWRVEVINGLPCVKWPLQPMFYWSFGAQNQQDQVPKIKVRSYVGTFWFDYHYAAVKEYMELQGYEPDSPQYLKEAQGCYGLKFGDPHVVDVDNQSL
ncbi:hypothetical protein L218DRAFT_1007370 [Marasmius fiardii PR-910]|nr:hypothetical protein L218DRAFT_1007370 [Marasmius fiardii PR-910]